MEEAFVLILCKDFFDDLTVSDSIDVPNLAHFFQTKNNLFFLGIPLPGIGVMVSYITLSGHLRPIAQKFPVVSHITPLII